MSLQRCRWCAGLVVLGWLAVVVPVMGADEPQAAPAAPETTPAAPVAERVVPQIERALAAMFPQGTLLYVAWPGVDVLAETSKDTALAKLLKEPEVVRFRERWQREAWPAIEKLITEEIGDDEEGVAVFKAVKDTLADLWRYPAAIGVIGVGMGEAGPQVDAAIVVRAGKDAEALVKRIEQLASMAGLPTDAAGEMPVKGAKLKEVPLLGPALPLRWGTVGGDVVVSVGPGMLDHLCAGGEAKGLARSERFAAAMKITGGTEAAPTFFLDLQGVIGALEAFQPMFAGFMMPVLGEEGGVKKLLEGLGLAKAESLSIVTAPESGGFKTSVLLHIPRFDASANPLLAQEPLTDADLAIVPKDASWMAVGNTDLLASYRQIMKMLNTIAPPVHAMIGGAIGGFEERMGLKIEDDLLGSFGNTFAIFDAPSQGGIWFTGTTVVAEVKPGNKLDACLEKLVGALAEEVGTEFQVAIATEEYRGQKIRMLNMTGIPIPVAPAWAEYEGRWVVALYPQMVRVTLDRLMDKGESILANPDFVRGRKLMPAKPHALHYVDTQAAVQQLYSVALPIAQMLTAMGQGEGVPIDVTMLPAASALTRHLFGNVSASAVTRDGLLTVSHGPLPVSVPAIGEGGLMLPMMVGVMVPRLHGPRGQARRVVGAANLKSIGVAALVYAEEHKGNLPPDLQTLIDEGSIPPQSLISPLDKTKDAKCSYVYVPGQATTMDPRNVVAYENPEICGGKGINVSFLDGHVQFMSMPEFEKALAETNKRLGRTGEPAAELK